MVVHCFDDRQAKLLSAETCIQPLECELNAAQTRTMQLLCGLAARRFSINPMAESIFKGSLIRNFGGTPRVLHGRRATCFMFIHEI